MRRDSTAKRTGRGTRRPVRGGGRGAGSGRHPDRIGRHSDRAGRLPDRVGPRLRVLFVGINPGLRSAAVRHHFAGHSNRFWPLLHESGLTPTRLTWRDDASLPGIGLGLTNLVSRATAGSAALNRDDFARGERILRRKVRRLRPRIVALVGLTLARALEGPVRPGRRIRLGEVHGRFEGAPLVVLPNPSGRNASISYAEMVRAYRCLSTVVQNLS